MHADLAETLIGLAPLLRDIIKYKSNCCRVALQCLKCLMNISNNVDRKEMKTIFLNICRELWLLLSDAWG